VKSATDWRKHYAKSPGPFLAMAVGGGLLLALAMRRHRSGRGPAPRPRSNPVPSGPREKGQLDDSISLLKGALIGLAAEQAKSMLSKWLPGLEAQLAQRDKFKTTGPVDPPRQADPRNGASNIG
jgi:hypothetical protein